jgi:mannose-1-phosphate guanylyltransferase
MERSYKIIPVILSGGGGTRLWPMSLPERPKQFLALTSEKTMFTETLARTADATRFDRPIIVANERHRALIETQLEGVAAIIILEPAARNTAPAIALAALAASSPEAPLLVMPSDHVIADGAAFQAAIQTALPLVADGWLVTFGIAPAGPETGYGYIQAGEPVGQGVFRVARFVEKPDRASAEAMLAQGNHVWNGGIFMFRADAYLGALAVHAPDMLAAAQQAMARAGTDGNVINPDAGSFAGSPADSIDYAVMEKADRVAVIPVAIGWSDIGSWDALYDHGIADGTGHVLSGDVIAIDSQNCLIRADGVRVAMVGCKDLIVVASGDQVLIMPRGRSQEVKRVVEQLSNASAFGRPAHPE